MAFQQSSLARLRIKWLPFAFNNNNHDRNPHLEACFSEPCPWRCSSLTPSIWMNWALTLTSFSHSQTTALPLPRRSIETIYSQMCERRRGYFGTSMSISTTFLESGTEGSVRRTIGILSGELLSVQYNFVSLQFVFCAETHLLLSKIPHPLYEEVRGLVQPA